jgi:hypothetical protein
MGQGIEYEAPQIGVCGAFFVENIAVVQSPVKGVTLEAWVEVDAEDIPAEDGWMPLW